MFFKSTPRKSRHAFNYRPLEDRCLLAGDVTVVENVHLYLRGDGLDNQIEVVVEGDELVINGLDGTTINGKESFTVQGTTVTDSGVTFAGGLRGHFGPGHDDLNVKDAIFESRSIIYGGTGDDNIEIVDSQFVDGGVIQTFDGDDSVSTMGTSFGDDLFVITLDGQDSVTSIDSSFDGNAIVVTGEHSDKIHSEGNHYMGDVNLILTLNGNDEVQLVDPVVGESQLGVFLGNHDDTIGVDLSEASVEGTIRIGGQAGSDQHSGMTMNDEVADRTSVFGIEKGELVFESALGGIDNVVDAQRSYTEPVIYENRTDTYTHQFATGVVLDTTQTINQIEWSGSYARDLYTTSLPDLGDSFIIEIFEGNGSPNSMANAVRLEVGSGQRVLAGEISYGEFGISPLYEYHAEIEYTMEAGKQYWVSIYTDLGRQEAANGDIWMWGSGRDATMSPTLFNDAMSGEESNWSNGNEEPLDLSGLGLDLRLRS